MSDHSNSQPPIDPARLERVLNSLPWLEREAFLLKTRDLLSYAEVGLCLGLSAEAAEARVVAALVKVHARLEAMDRPWWRFW